VSEDRSREREKHDKQGNDYAGDHRPPRSCNRRSLLKRPPARAIEACGHAGVRASDGPEVMLGRGCRRSARLTPAWRRGSFLGLPDLINAANRRRRGRRSHISIDQLYFAPSRLRAGRFAALSRSCGDASARSCGDASARSCGDASARSCADASARSCGEPGAEYGRRRRASGARTRTRARATADQNPGGRRGTSVSPTRRPAGSVPRRSTRPRRTQPRRSRSAASNPGLRASRPRLREGRCRRAER
jgi:hypothetical protein